MEAYLGYLGCVLEESFTDWVEYSRKVVIGRKVANAIRSLVNPRDLQLEYPRVLLETLLVPCSYEWHGNHVMEGEGEI